MSKSGIAESDHFLALKVLIEGLQLKFKQEITEIKASIKHPNFNIPWYDMAQHPVPLPPNQPQIVAHQHIPQPTVPGNNLHFSFLTMNMQSVEQIWILNVAVYDSIRTTAY